jgi:RNA polymerase sigma-70 factor (ECF subfamily)
MFREGCHLRRLGQELAEGRAAEQRRTTRGWAFSGFVLATGSAFVYHTVTRIMASLEHSGAVVAENFQSTHWSVVLAANQADSPQAREALGRLCQSYWYPVYAFIRRRGSDAEPAKDLTQEFFSRLLEKQFLRVADRERGRFRTFLMSCVEHFLSNEHKREHRLKRGGRYTFVPLEDASAEDRYQTEPADDMSPDKLLDRRWALTVLELSFALLKQEYADAGKLAQFEALHESLSGATEAPCSFAEIGARLGMTEGATRQAAFRMRSRFGELLRQNVAQTVASPQDLAAELGHLRAVLSAT